MEEYRTKEELLREFAKPSKNRYLSYAVSLMKNFCIEKTEADSYGTNDVRYRIVDLECYLYSNEDPSDYTTLNRDCIEGQWFFHGYGVDIAFRTDAGEDHELRQFGGILIRGLEKYVNGQCIGTYCGCKRCMLELFNNTDSLPKLKEAEPLANIEVYNTMRVQSIKNPPNYRFFKKSVHWEMPRSYVFQTQNTENGEKKYHIWHKEKSLTADKYEQRPQEEGLTPVYSQQSN